MKWTYNTKYPSIEDLKKRARARVPRFAYEYLDGGCNDDVNLQKNTAEIREIELAPYYLAEHKDAEMRTELFGHTYDAPFGIAPIGLQGLIWPNAAEILAKAAMQHNIPFILSTVTTSSIERISEITEGKAWFQLYHPAKTSLRDSILQRLNDRQYPVLVLLSDVPTFGYRPRDIRNGLAMPPSMTLNNIMQIMTRPQWAIKTLVHGSPNFETLKPYMSKGMNMKQLGQFMNQTFSGRLSHERVAQIRDKWKGKLVLKGVATQSDVEAAVKLGLDGVIVSNHGGRQLDAGQSSIQAMIPIVQKYQHKLKIMLDSGLRSGPDIARALAAGADFTFLGRSFMYSVAALGNKGGDHICSVLKTELKQVMDQICCPQIDSFPNHLIQPKSKFNPLLSS